MQLDFFKALERLASVQDIRVMHVAPPYENLHLFDYGLRDSLDPYFDWTDFGDILQRGLPQGKLLYTADTFGVLYAMFRLPDEKNAFYVVGPWSNDEEIQIRRDWMSKHFTGETMAAINAYYGSVRRLETDAETRHISSILALLKALEPPQTFEVERREEFLPLNFRPKEQSFLEPAFREEMPIALIEQRYEAETKLLDCIARGDEAGSIAQMQQMKRFSYGGRFEKSLYARKTKLVIFSTLMRKAIQQSQVHPYYIDKISEHYFLQIENMTESDERPLVRSMIHDYCAYVRMYSLKSYSPLVRKVLNQINLHMEEDLSLKSLAGMYHISPSYLSTLFKQESGMTLTDCVNTKRMQRAAHILITTDLSVSAVAEQVGILDVNYFAKMFKGILGDTPTQYRKKNRDTSEFEESAAGMPDFARASPTRLYAKAKNRSSQSGNRNMSLLRRKAQRPTE